MLFVVVTAQREENSKLKSVAWKLDWKPQNLVIDRWNRLQRPHKLFDFVPVPSFLFIFYIVSSASIIHKSLGDKYAYEDKRFVRLDHHKGMNTFPDSLWFRCNDTNVWYIGRNNWILLPWRYFIIELQTMQIFHEILAGIEFYEWIHLLLWTLFGWVE